MCIISCGGGGALQKIEAELQAVAIGQERPRQVRLAKQQELDHNIAMGAGGLPRAVVG